MLYERWCVSAYCILICGAECWAAPALYLRGAKKKEKEAERAQYIGRKRSKGCNILD